jgi:hypothetical protein
MENPMKRLLADSSPIGQPSEQTEGTTEVDHHIKNLYSDIASAGIYKDNSQITYELDEQIEKVSIDIISNATKFSQLDENQFTRISGLLPSSSKANKGRGIFYLNYSREHFCIVVPNLSGTCPELSSVFYRLFKLIEEEQLYFKPLDIESMIYKGKQDELLQILKDLTTSFLATDDELGKQRTVSAVHPVSKAFVEHLREKLAREYCFETGLKLTQEWFSKTFSQINSSLANSVQGSCIKVMMSIISRLTSSSHDNMLKKNVIEAIQNTAWTKVTPNWCVKSLQWRYHDMRALNSCIKQDERSLLNRTNFFDLLDIFDKIIQKANNGDFNSIRRLNIFSDEVQAGLGNALLRYLYDRLKVIGAEKQKRINTQRRAIDVKSGISKSQTLKTLTLGSIVLNDDEKSALFENTQDGNLNSKALFMLAIMKIAKSGLQLYHLRKYITRQENNIEVLKSPEKLLDDPVITDIDPIGLLSLLKTLISVEIHVDSFDEQIMTSIYPDFVTQKVQQTINKPAVATASARKNIDDDIKTRLSNTSDSKTSKYAIR